MFFGHSLARTMFTMPLMLVLAIAAMTASLSAATQPPGVLVRDIAPGSAESDPSFFADVNGVVFFGAYDGVHGYELWKSNGTAAGTVMVKDINTAGDGLFSNSEGSIGVVNGKAIFAALDATTVGTWVSDGTSAGTFKLTSVVRTDGVTANGLHYFAANSQLWKTDGTVTGTVPLKATPTDPQMFAVTPENVIYFFAGNQLWTSDGTAAGTVQVTTGLSDVPIGKSYAPVVARYNNFYCLYFIAKDVKFGYRLWRSDGTYAGTDAVPQPTWSTSLIPTMVGMRLDGIDTVFFHADDGSHGNQLWSTNGVTCTKVTDFAPGLGSGAVMSRIVALNGAYYLVAATGPSTAGLHITNGTTAGTWSITATPLVSTSFFAASGNLYWGAADGTVWVSDGSAFGTHSVPNSLAGNPTVGGAPALVGNTVFWQGTDTSHTVGQELYSLANSPPFIVASATVGPNPVVGKSTTLHVIADDDGGEAQLKYTWTMTHGPATPVFSPNGTNAAKDSKVTFSQYGAYDFLVTVTDAGGLTTTSPVSVTVNQTRMSLKVTPAAITLTPGATQQFTVQPYDQFGLPIPGSPPAYAWTQSGSGSITSGGFYTAQTTPATHIGIKAAWGGDIGLAQVQVVSSAQYAQKVNFQASTSVTPVGYLPDDGSFYGLRSNGFSYGWTINQTDAARERGVNPDKRLDTLNQFHAGSIWKMQVPNGTYSVLVSIGDPSFASTYTLNVNGVNYWTNLPLGVNAFASATKTITVTNGLLSLDQGAAGEKATRINYLEITTANPAGGYVVTVTGDKCVALGATIPIVVTLAGAAGNHTIALTNGAAFSDNTTSKVQACPSSVTYSIKPGSSAGNFNITADGATAGVETVYSVTIADLPSRTTDSNHPCPLGIPTGVPKTLAITINGDLVSAGQMIGFDVTKVDAAAGEGIVQGNSQLDVSGNITIRGEVQASDYPGKSNVVALFNADPERKVASGKPFTICNHPSIIQFGQGLPGYVDEAPNGLYGVFANVLVISDGVPNGSTGNCDGGMQKCLYWEVVPQQISPVTNPFTPSTIPTHAQSDAAPHWANTSYHDLVDMMILSHPFVIYNDPNSNVLQIQQGHKFTCTLCGAQRVTVPNGGFLIEHYIDAPVTGYNPVPQLYHFHKFPFSTIIAVPGDPPYSSNPGQGTITTIRSQTYP